MAKVKEKAKTQPLLNIEKLEAGYGPLQVLFGVDLHVKPKEIVALIGPNGAGKSTVLRSVFGLTNRYKGQIFFRGKNITDSHTYDLISLGIGYVPQGRQVFPSLSVQENLEMGAWLSRDRDVINKRMEEALSHFPDLKPKLKQKAFSLSGGQQQMLATARGLMQDPHLLLMDEPSAGLSPKLMTELFKKIQDIRNEGTAVLLVEQNAKQACSIADRIYLLEDGKVALTGGRSILKRPEIKHVYLGGR